MKLIERTFYLDKLKDVMKAADINVITGVRRNGSQNCWKHLWSMSGRRIRLLTLYTSITA